LTLIVGDNLESVAERAAAIQDLSFGTYTIRTTSQPQLLLHDLDGYEVMLVRAGASS
jgi:hypothetical protein